MKKPRSPYRRRLRPIPRNLDRIFSCRRLTALWAAPRKRKRRCVPSASCRRLRRPQKQIARKKSSRTRRLAQRLELLVLLQVGAGRIRHLLRIKAHLYGGAFELADKGYVPLVGGHCDVAGRSLLGKKKTAAVARTPCASRS